MEKICNRCQKTMPRELFAKDARRADGYRNYCLSCVREMAAAHYVRNRESILQRLRRKYVQKPRFKLGDLAHDGVKTCCRCGIEKPAVRDYFTRDKTQADGFDIHCRTCRSELQRASRERHILFMRERRKSRRQDEISWRAKIRAEFIAAYGGKCACCGEGHPEFLTLDHIGGRTELNHPWSGRAGTHIYAKLKKLGWPKNGYRILCMNCNWAVRYGSPCPHQSQ